MARITDLPYEIFCQIIQHVLNEYRKDHPLYREDMIPHHPEIFRKSKISRAPIYVLRRLVPYRAYRYFESISNARQNTHYPEDPISTFDITFLSLPKVNTVFRSATIDVLFEGSVEQWKQKGLVAIFRRLVLENAYAIAFDAIQNKMDSPDPGYVDEPATLERLLISPVFCRFGLLWSKFDLGVLYHIDVRVIEDGYGIKRPKDVAEKTSEFGK